MRDDNDGENVLQLVKMCVSATQRFRCAATVAVLAGGKSALLINKVNIVVAVQKNVTAHDFSVKMSATATVIIRVVKQSIIATPDSLL